MNTQRNTQKGFTLLELMVVLVIIGILAALAVPTYQGQVKRAKFAEVISATAPTKAAVAACIQKEGASGIGASGTCDAASNGIPADLDDAAGHLNDLTVANGVITASGDATVDSLTYILTPAYTGGIVTWTVSGTCAAAGLC